MNAKILGLDIGSSTIKMALCKSGVLLKSATVNMLEGLMVEDRITDPERLGDLIKTIMRAKGMRANKMALVVSNEVCFLRELTMPRMTVSQLEKNLPYEFTSYIEGDLKDYVFDYQILSEVSPDDENMSLMVAALPGELVEQVQIIARRAGMRVVRIAPNESAFQAIIRQGAGVTAQHKEFCFLNLGYNATRMFMFHGDRHAATRVLDNSLRVLEQAIMSDLGIERAVAHQYLLENRDNCLDREACMEIYRSIAVELMRALNFYRFSNPDSMLEDVWLCGGGAAIRPLRDIINETLGIAVHRAEELLQSADPVEDAFNYVQAYGVTMDFK
ncbi:MAG: pilus assembly protein PilM [Oscillospiraceae bacterium]|nr:pilus assembly protein PilM [Oscillospiraceae bacterium]